jgi:hypothetical protein
MKSRNSIILSLEIRVGTRNKWMEKIGKEAVRKEDTFGNKHF